MRLIRITNDIPSQRSLLLKRLLKHKNEYWKIRSSNVYMLVRTFILLFLYFQYSHNPVRTRYVYRNYTYSREA